MKLGIEAISLYTPNKYLSLEKLAQARGVDPKKFITGIGQEKMAVPAPDEDVVTMGANAAYQAIQQVDDSSIDTVIFATESGIDQSKAASIYVHSLLGLSSSCRSFEVKQACCSSTAALYMAMSMVALKPEKRVLIIASDVARYGLETAGEPTQGGGAIAMVVSATPTIVSFDTEFGSYTEDVMDFWRPNYRDEAVVDGKYSIKIYLKALEESWKNYLKESNASFGEFDYFCYHLPFTRMAEKAHFHLGRIAESDLSREELAVQMEDSLHYNRIIGNCYTASLYIGLLSLLDTADKDLSGKRIGMFSYGSGAMASFFSATVCEGYKKALQPEQNQKMLAAREEISVEEYQKIYAHQLPVDGSEYKTAQHETGRYRLAGISDHKRIYEAVKATVPAEELVHA